MIITKLVFAEPRPQTLDVFAEALSLSPDLRVVARTDDVATTLLQLERTGAPLLLVGAGMSDNLASLCAGVHHLSSRPRTLFLDDEPDQDHLLEAVEAGIDGYTTGVSGAGVVVRALRATAQGESVIPPSMLGPLLKRLIQRRRDAEEAADRLRALTSREREVLGLLVDGCNHHAIAARLVISPETARTHVQRIMRKLGVHSRTEAIELAIRSGIAEQLQRALERSAS
jgi:DNA-binding NarL/FixJ family response regulator